jgi:hypothetical protein
MKGAGFVGAGIHRDQELESLRLLAVELVKLSLQVGLSDAGPALILRGDTGRITMVVTADANQFQWRRGEDTHDVSDPVGAAGAIASTVWTHGADPSESS